jgi:heme/copper-type cytochrome/quinol oxidase subunit 2
MCRCARLGLAILGVMLAVIAGPTPVQMAGPVLRVQIQGPTERPFSVTARRYAFAPARIEVFEGDLVKIELRTEDIAHSLTIDDYRISKRVGPGQPVTFEFRAARAGTFAFYCDLQNEAGCRKMRGELVVKPHR